MDREANTQAILELSRFWVQKIFVPIMLCMGLTGNIITVMVMTRRRMRSSTNTYLSALAIADIIHLIFGFLLSFVHYKNIHDRKYELYWRFFGLTHWLCDAASATSAWLAVSFTLERYIAVCHPMRGRVLCTERRAKSIIVIIYIFCILTTASTTFEYQLTFSEECVTKCKLEGENLSIISNSSELHYQQLSSDNPVFYTNPNVYDAYFQSQLKHILSNCTDHPHIIYVPIYPKFIKDVEMSKLQPTTTMAKFQADKNVLEKQPDELNGPKAFLEGSEAFHNDTEIANETCCVKNLTIDVESTELGKSGTYKSFINWYSAMFFIIIPFGMIATFNCFLVRAVYLSQKMRRVMTNSQEHITFTNEKRITIMLIGVVFIFLICNAPTASLLIYYYFHSPSNTTLILGNVFNLLVMMNAPCNFILYCLLSKKFRSTFRLIFWERRIARQLETETILLSSTKSKNPHKFNPYKHGLMKRNASEYHTPRNLEAQSLTSIPRSKSLMTRPVGKARSSDLNV